MNRLLYEKAVSYKGHLIIPFLFGKADSEAIYLNRREDPQYSLKGCIEP
jgi:hypothetical protein